MPELPEVEVIARGLRPLLIGKTCTALSTSEKKLRLPVPEDDIRRELIGHRITEVSRRAKYLKVVFDKGAMLVIHLGMTGTLSLHPAKSALDKHDHLCFSLSDGQQLRYRDPRRFGSIQLITPEQVSSLETTVFTNLGPEPFSPAFSADHLYRLAQSREIAIKPFLMTNSVVVGVGNIYASESLFAAGISPLRKAKTIRKRQWNLVIEKVRETLQLAIDCGGSSISDYLNANGERGYFQMQFQVYGRTGQACRQCQATIAMVRQGGRAGFFCPACQR